MVTEGTISREEYMRQRGPVNEAAPSAPDGSLIPMASQPVQTPLMKPVVSEDILRPGPMGMNMAATSQALETPQALRSEKMTMAQSAALGVNDLNPVRLATGDRGYEAAMTRSLEDNPITTRVGQTAALTAGGGAQLTNRALVYAPKLVAPAVAARFAGSRAAQYLGRAGVLAGTGAADFYAYNALAEAPNQARMTGAPSPTMGQRIDYANSQVFTPAGLISAGLPVAGSVIARGVRGGIAATKNLATTGSATTRTLPGGGTAQVPVSNLFTPASVQRSVAAGQAINAQSKSARGRTAREEAIDLLIAKGISADETEKLVKLISYDNYTTVDEMLFELANADIDQLAVAAARVGGDAKKTFREAFKARNAEMPERIRTQLRDAMALSGDELEDFAAQMAARADEATADGYTAAYAQQISDTTWGKMWDRLSVSPDAREAIAAGARLARNSYRGNPAQLDVARQLEQLASALDSPSAIPPKLSTHALDYLDRGFGSLIAGQKKNNQAFASSLIEIQKALRDAGLDADTGLAGPRQVYSQFKAAGRALEFGAKAFGRGTSLKDLKKQFAASLKDADEVFEDIVGEGRSVVDQALIMGWLRGAEDAIETATNPGQLLRQIYGSERQRAKLLEMMPSETDVMTSGVKGDQTKRIKALVGSELGKEDYTFNFGLGSGARAEGRRAVPSLFERQRTMLENQGRVSGNSVTGDVTEAIANQGGLQRAAGLIAQSVMNPQQAAQNAALWAVQRATLPAIFKPEVNRELGRILTTRGREQILEIVAEIRARQAATGKGPKPPAAPGTPPRGTPPSGSPAPSPNALAPQGPIRAAGFGGLQSKTANRAAYDQAVALETSGASRREIWDQTGWFRDVDGNWKYEIDNSASRFKAQPSAEDGLPTRPDGSLKAGRYKLGDIYENQNLYDAYPELSDIVVTVKYGKSGGAAFNPATRSVEVVIPKGGDGSVGRTGIAHEVAGHAIQAIERFNGGKSFYKDGPLKYWYSDGEVSARNIETRLDGDKTKAPWETIDVPEDRIVGSKPMARPSPIREALVQGGLATVGRASFGYAGGAASGYAVDYNGDGVLDEKDRQIGAAIGVAGLAGGRPIQKALTNRVFSKAAQSGANGLPLRGDLGNALAGAGLGAAGPADSNEERLRNIGIGFGVGLGARRVGKAFGAGADDVATAGVPGGPRKPSLPDFGYDELSIGKASVEVTRVGDGMTINRIKVPQDARGQGEASKALKEVLRQADEQGLTVFLTADPVGAGGMSKAQLEAFYKRNGFVPNKGRNKDFSSQAGMIRPPASPILTAGVGGPRKPVPPRTVGKSKLGTRTADAAAITTLAAGGPTAEADTVDPRAEAQARIDELSQNQAAAQELITEYEQSLKDFEALSPTDKQIFLKNNGYRGPNGEIVKPDGDVRGVTGFAIDTYKKELNDALAAQKAERDNFRKEINRIRVGLAQKPEKQTNPLVDKALEFGTYGAMVYGAHRFRGAMVKGSQVSANRAAAKANALLTRLPVPPEAPKKTLLSRVPIVGAKDKARIAKETKAANKAQFATEERLAGRDIPPISPDPNSPDGLPNRLANVDEFDRQRAAGDFGPVGRLGRLMEPVNSRVRAADLAVIGTGAADTYLMEGMLQKTRADIAAEEGRLKDALAANNGEGDPDAVEVSTKRLEQLRQAETVQVILQRVGIGLMIGGGFGLTHGRYVRPQPRFEAAARERDLINRAMMPPPAAAAPIAPPQAPLSLPAPAAVTRPRLPPTPKPKPPVSFSRGKPRKPSNDNDR
jgi:hypothetical protein